MICYTINTRGHYKCNFCDHKTYKTASGVQTHLQINHELEMTKALLEENRAEVTKLRSQPPKVKVVEKERIVYRDPPAKAKVEYWYLPQGHGIYCSSCKQVQMGVGIPNGQTIESTPHKCGNRTLMLVTDLR